MNHPALHLAFALALLALLLLVGFATCKGDTTDRAAGAEAGELFPYAFDVDDLPNGLRLITIPTDHPDLVSMHILVGVGSRNEVEEGKSGFAHFFEHMMFRGSENFSSEEQARIFKQIGAGRNAYTTDDFTNYHTDFAKQDLETVFEIEADRFQRLKYSQKVFRTEAQAVFGEYNKNSAQPINKLLEVLRDTAFERHPYKHTTMGFLADIVKMPRQYQYSLEFFDRWYRPEHTTILLVGDVERERSLALARKYFGDWERGSHSVEIPEEPPQDGPRRCHVPWPQKTQPWLAVAFRGPAFSPEEEDMPTLDVISAVAFSPSSELYQRLFIEERKVDALFAYFPDHRDPFLVTVLARLKDASDLAYVRDRILSTCEALGSQSVSTERLQAVKSNLKYSFAASLDSTSNIASGLAGHIARTRTPATISTLYDTYDRITAADLQRVARRYFVADHRTVCTLVSGEEDAPAPELAPVAITEARIEGIPDANRPAPALAERLDLDSSAAPPAAAALLPSRSPLISFRIVFPTGAAADPKAKEGLANITAQMLTAAATSKRSYEDVVAAFFPMASGLGAQVDKEMTVFDGSIHRDNLANYYDLVLEMLAEPGFRQEDLDRIKANTITAIDAGLRRSDDEETGKEVLYGEIYAGHPYAHLNLGTLAGIESITLDDVRGFYRREFRGAFPALAGGYPAGLPGRLAADLAAAFGPAVDPSHHARSRAEAAPAPVVLESNRLTIVQKTTRATGMHLGFPIEVTRGHPDFAALWLVRSWFGQHRSENSHLYQRLRELRGLNYGDYAYIEYFPHGGSLFQPAPNLARTRQIFQIWIRPVDPKNGPFTFKAMCHELDKLVANGLTESDFQATRTYLSKYVHLLVASQDRQLGYAIDSRFYGIGPFAATLEEELAKLTLADVNRVIREHLRSDHVHYVVVTEDAIGFRDALLGEAPTPITYGAGVQQDPDVLAEDDAIAAFRVRLDPADVQILDIEDIFAR